MKICFINAPVGTINGSQESVVYFMAENLSKYHDVTLITGRGITTPLIERVKNGSFHLVKVPFLSRNSILNRIISKIIKRAHPWGLESLTIYLGVLMRPKVKEIIKRSDVIVTYYRSDSRRFSNLAYRYGVPCVSNFQFAALGEEFFKADKSVVYLANSQFSKEFIEKENEIRIEGVITPGVSQEYFDGKTQEIQEMKEVKSILFVGELIKRKGIYELLEIFSDISSRFEDAKLYIIGGGELKELIEKKALELDLKGRIKLVGLVEHDQMPAYYRSATLMIHPSHEETFGMVVLEAMASGLPVIASNLKAHEEVTGGTAILLPLGDIKQWIEKVDYLLANPEARQRMAEKGVEKAKEHLWEKKSKQLERYLIKATQKKGNL